MDGRGRSRRRRMKQKAELWKRLISGLLVCVIMISMVFNVPIPFGRGQNVLAAEEPENMESRSTWATASNARYHRGQEKDIDIYIVSNDNEVMPGNETELVLYLKNNTEEEITDGSLKFKSRFISKEDGSFEALEGTEEMKNQPEAAGQEEAVWESVLNEEAGESGSETKDTEEEEKEEAEETKKAGENEDCVLTDICILPGEMYPVLFTFYTQEDAKMAKASVEFIFTGEGEERNIRSEEKFYYGIGMPYVSLELEGGTQLETGTRNELNIWMMEPGWYLDDWENEKAEELEEKYREQIELFEVKASDSDAKRLASDSDAEQTASDSDAGRETAESEDTAAKPAAETEKIQEYVDKAMYIDESSVSYEVEIFGTGFQRFKAQHLDHAEDIGWISCLYELARDARPGLYYGKVTASGKWHKKSFSSMQGFWFEVTGEGTIELSDKIDGGKVLVQGPVSSFPETESLNFQASEIAEETEQSLEEALVRMEEEAGVAIGSYRAMELKLLADGEETEPLGTVNVRFEDLKLKERRPEEEDTEPAERLEDEEQELISEMLSAGNTEFKVFYLDEEEGTLVETDSFEESDGAIVMETDHFSVYVVAELSHAATDLQRMTYERFLAEIKALEALEELDEEARAAAEDLMQRIQEAYEKGELTENDYADLHARLFTLLYGDVGDIAEYVVGTNWMDLRDSGWFEEYSEYGTTDDSADDANEHSLYETTDYSHTPNSRLRSAMRTAARNGNGGTVGEPDPPSAVQITDKGGENSSAADGVTVSKTIAGTELENVFDITLRVQTESKISEIYEDPDMAVVIVMDISNTMNEDFGESTKYRAAMVSAEAFVEKFRKKNNGISKIGYVAFNTNAHQICGMQSCSTEQQAGAFINNMRTKTGDIINNYVSLDPTRYTNIEAGLKMAQDMLRGVSNNHKYIIFLSDGLPTTYIKNDYEGYVPESTSVSSSNIGKDGYFYDRIYAHPLKYGCNYSDKAAQRAQNVANQLKNTDGVTIFSVGAGLNSFVGTYASGLTGVGMINDQLRRAREKEVSTIDNNRTDPSTMYIGDLSNNHAFEEWLKDRIGSGYYYDSTDTEGLQAAYDEIFKQILQIVKESSQADWVSRDPVPTVSGSAETIEFIGFYNQEQELIFKDLEGNGTEGGENTAVFDDRESAINWDLKNSGYMSATSGNTTIYTYQLVYRVRLKNENQKKDVEGNPMFVEKKAYPTNDTTELHYRTITGTNGSDTISELKKIEFPIPSVQGYLADLTFKKTGLYENALPGAEFTLSHDKEHCAVCRGDGTSSVVIGDFVETSNSDGMVTFEKIPSGHQYTLTETKVPDGYVANGDTYRVVVAYDEITVTVTHPDGKTADWDMKLVNQIVNRASIELPETGGPGTIPYMIGGLLLMAAADFFLIYKKNKYRKEDMTSF